MRDGAAERDDLAAGLELAEEEHVVDQLPRLLHLEARLLDELVDVGLRKRRALEQDEHPRERRPELVRDGGGEAGPQLLVRRQLRERVEEEHERARLGALGVLSETPARRHVAERLRGGGTRRDEPPLAVEHDDGVAGRRQNRADPLDFGTIHHTFTSRSPLANPSMPRRRR